MKITSLLLEFLTHTQLCNSNMCAILNLRKVWLTKVSLQILTNYEIKVLKLITDIQLYRYMALHKPSVNAETIQAAFLLWPFWKRHLLKTSVYKSIKWSFSSGSLKFPWATSTYLSSGSKNYICILFLFLHNVLNSTRGMEAIFWAVRHRGLGSRLHFSPLSFFKRLSSVDWPSWSSERHRRAFPRFLLWKSFCLNFNFVLPCIIV